MASVDQIRAQIREILGDQYMQLKVGRFEYSEDLETAETRVRCDLRHKGPDEGMTIVGQGVGLLDALFNAVKEKLGRAYPSLNSLQIEAFSVRGKMETGRSASGADALANAVLEVRNSEGRCQAFEAENRSVAAATVQATLTACEFFVNSERAFKRVYKLLEDAKQRRRSDLEESYVAKLSELVKNTSYSEVIEQLRKKI